jgi:hypothetical protein
VLNKLLHFAAPIPATRQYFRHKTDQAISFLKWIRISSEDTQMFNFFQTFSAADIHWNDLHRILPGSERYLDKTVVEDMAILPEEERDACISQADHHVMRSKAVKDNADIVDWYFYHRLKAMIDHVLPILGVEDYIIRYEVQACGTIHAHLLLQVKDGPSANDMKFAFRDIAAEKDAVVKEKISAALEKVVHFATKQFGTSAVHPEPNPDFWPGPWGRDVHRPPTNILRQQFLDITQSTEYKERHKKQINRTMLHKCKMAYCLDEKRKDGSGHHTCRFYFPMETFGFRENFSQDGRSIESVRHGLERQERVPNFSRGT